MKRVTIKWKQNYKDEILFDDVYVAISADILREANTMLMITSSNNTTVLIPMENVKYIQIEDN